MVFFKLGTGLLVGMTIPFFCNDLIYYTIANSFLRPHLKYQLHKEKMSKNLAPSQENLDTYFIDVVGSFFLFFIVIGPIVYQSMVQKDGNEEKNVDEVAEIVKKIKNKGEINQSEDY